jgi:hypothetical protein
VEFVALRAGGGAEPDLDRIVRGVEREPDGTWIASCGALNANRISGPDFAPNSTVASSGGTVASARSRSSASMRLVLPLLLGPTMRLNGTSSRLVCRRALNRRKATEAITPALCQLARTTTRSSACNPQ